MACLGIKVTLEALKVKVTVEEKLFNTSKDSINRVGTEINNFLEQHRTTLQTEIDKLRQTLQTYNENLAKVQGEFDNQVDKLFTTVRDNVDNVDKQIQQANDEMINKVTSFQEKLTVNSKAAIQLMEKETSQPIQTLKNNIQKCRQEISQQSNDVLSEGKQIFESAHRSMHQFKEYVQTFEQNKGRYNNYLNQCSEQVLMIDNHIAEIQGFTLEKIIKDLQYDELTKRDTINKYLAGINELKPDQNDSQVKCLEKQQEKLEQLIAKVQETCNSFNIPSLEQLQNQSQTEQYDKKFAEVEEKLIEVSHTIKQLQQCNKALISECNKELKDLQSNIESFVDNKETYKLSANNQYIINTQVSQLQQGNEEIVQAFVQQYRTVDPKLAYLLEYYLLRDTIMIDLQHKKINLMSLKDKQIKVLNQLAQLRKDISADDTFTNETAQQSKKNAYDFFKQHDMRPVNQDDQQSIMQYKGQINKYMEQFQLRKSLIQRCTM